MPAIMGQACAAYALCEIGEKPFTVSSFFVVTILLTK